MTRSALLKQSNRRSCIYVVYIRLYFQQCTSWRASRVGVLVQDSVPCCPTVVADVHRRDVHTYQDLCRTLTAKKKLELIAVTNMRLGASFLLPAANARALLQRFLRHTIGGDGATVAVSFPQFFGHPLERHIAPRHAFLVASGRPSGACICMHSLCSKCWVAFLERPARHGLQNHTNRC